jgi:hypothetical protein
MNEFKQSTGTFKFTDRASYLECRSQWRAAYAQLSQDIRDLKWCRKYANQIGNPERYEAVKKRLATKWGFYPQSQAFALRGVATVMIEEYKAAKADCQRLYMIQKTAQTKAAS